MRRRQGRGGGRGREPTKNNRKSNKPNSQKPSVVYVKRNGLADRTIVQLSYEDIVPIAQGTAYGIYQFRGNSPYDPDYTSTGHQPLYYDQYALEYERYRCLKSSITVDMVNSGAVTGSMFGILPHTDPLTTNIWSYFAERPMAKVCPNMMAVATRYGSQLHHVSTTGRVCGTTRGESLEEDYGAVVTTNPARQWYWTIFAQSSDSTSILTCLLRVRVVYYVQFYDRDDIGQSYDAHVRSSMIAEKAQRNRDTYLSYVTSQVADGKKQPRSETPVVTYNNVTLITPPPQLRSQS